MDPASSPHEDVQSINMPVASQSLNFFQSLVKKLQQVTHYWVYLLSKVQCSYQSVSNHPTGLGGHTQKYGGHMSDSEGRPVISPDLQQPTAFSTYHCLLCRSPTGMLYLLETPVVSVSCCSFCLPPTRSLSEGVPIVS